MDLNAEEKASSSNYSIYEMPNSDHYGFRLEWGGLEFTSQVEPNTYPREVLTRNDIGDEYTVGFINMHLFDPSGQALNSDAFYKDLVLGVWSAAGDYFHIVAEVMVIKPVWEPAITLSPADV